MIRLGADASVNRAPMTRRGAKGALIAILEVRTGQQLAPNREWLIETALMPLLRELGLTTLEELAGVATRTAAIGDRVADALLNQESSFFRDAAVLDTVAAAIDAGGARRRGRRVRIWSAGCSFGQEPLSLAMHFAETPSAAAAPEIVATDVSEAALARARAGRYTQFEIQRGLPVRRMMRWFDKEGSDWVAKPELVNRIAFRRQNLVADRAPGGHFDVILCRNVLLYLTPDLRRHIFDMLAGAIHPDGLLVLGAGETVIGQTERFRPSRRYRGLYAPVPGAAPTA